MRWKIIVPNLVVVLACGLAGWLYLSNYFTAHFDRQAREKLERDRNVFVDVNQLGAVEFLRSVMTRSRRPEMEAVFAPPQPDELEEVRRAMGRAPVEGEASTEPTEREMLVLLSKRAHRQCQAFRIFLGSEQAGGRTPEIVAITDRSGSVISRDVDPNAEPVGQDLGQRFPSLGRALQGNAVRDFWYWNNFLLDVAIAPLFNQGQVVGTLFVGYDVSNGVAQKNRDMFGVDVVYFVQQENQWRLHSSSIAAGAKRQSLVQQIGEHQTEITQSMERREGAGVFSLDVGGVDHIGLAGGLSAADSSVAAGYALLQSVEDVRAPAAQSIVVFFISLGGGVLILAIGLILGSYFLKPVEEIEEGILRVINGDITHRFEVNSAEFGGLAYRVNQLVAVLTGEEEEEENSNTAEGS